MSNRFMGWLRKSGIRYKLGVNSGREMIDHLNPFEPFFDGSSDSDEITLPALRVINSLFTTPVNLFNSIMGKHYDLYESGYGRKGLLDILIFPLVSRRLIAYSYDSQANPVLGAGAFIVGAPLEITRFALGTSLTVALLPVAFTANIVSSIFSPLFNYFKNKKDEKTKIATEEVRSTDSTSYQALYKKGVVFQQNRSDLQQQNGLDLQQQNRLDDQPKPEQQVDKSQDQCFADRPSTSTLKM